MGLGAPMTVGAAFGPIGLVVGGLATVGLGIIYLASNSRKETSFKPSISQRQKRGDLDSSEVEHYLHLGTSGAYEE